MGLISALLMMFTASTPTTDADQRWLVLRSQPTGHILSARPHMPSEEVRAAYPVEARLEWQYSPGDMPSDALLEVMYAFERQLRAADPLEQVFLQALRETGSGVRTWWFYARSEQAMRSVLRAAHAPAVDVTYWHDPTWSSLARVLGRTEE